jgi:hypothetical protein
MTGNAEPFAHAVAQAQGRAIGVPVTSVVDHPWPQREQMPYVGEVQVAWLCGLPDVREADRGDPRVDLLAAPVMRRAHYVAQLVYFTGMVVRGDLERGRWPICAAPRWPSTSRTRIPATKCCAMRWPSWACRQSWQLPTDQSRLAVTVKMEYLEAAARVGLLMAASVSTTRRKEADLLRDCLAGQGQFAATPGETRSRP